MWLLKAVRNFVLALGGLIGIILVANLSFWEGPPKDAEIKLIAHRGVHQTFPSEGLTNETCTAKIIHTPTHDYLENTIPSILAAFEHGADVVEIDVIKTADDEFAVFHDYTLDCRTNGTGRTKDHTLAELKTLDIGYGYTADNGRTFPFRGKGTGFLPSLRDVLNAFPDKPFLINVKSNRPGDALVLLSYLTEKEREDLDRLSLFSGPKFAEAWTAGGGGLTVGTRRGAKDCTLGYLKTGWFGHVPETCKQFGIAVPQGLGWIYPGWPHRLATRAEKAGAQIVLIGPNTKFSTGIDTIEQFDKIPAGFNGWVSTDRIEVIGPLVHSRPQ